MLKPENEAEAREVLETVIKSIIVRNVDGTRINATKASKEITDHIIKYLKETK